MLRVTRTALILLAAFSVFAQSHHAGDLTLEPYSFRTYDGSAHPAELGHLWVPENRSGPSGRLIEIAFVRLRSTARKPLSPVVFLPGGPGIPGTVMGRVPVYYEFFTKLQALSDVILVDQRGIGMSSPNTECPGASSSPPPAVFLKESTFRDALVAQARACADYWRAKGVDLAAYTTAASADDLEDLRRAVGAEKLSLLAHSYGTSLALTPSGAMENIWTASCSPESKVRTTPSGCRWCSISRSGGFPTWPLLPRSCAAHSRIPFGNSSKFLSNSTTNRWLFTFEVNAPSRMSR